MLYIAYCSGGFESLLGVFYLLFKSLVAWGMKLFLSLLVRVFGVLYLLPDGSRENRLLRGWVGSLIIFRDLLRQRWVYKFCSSGSSQPVTCWAARLTLLSALRSFAVQLP